MIFSLTKTSISCWLALIRTLYPWVTWSRFWISLSRPVGNKRVLVPSSLSIVRRCRRASGSSSSTASISCPVRNTRVLAPNSLSIVRRCCRTFGLSSSTASIQMNACLSWYSRIFNRAMLSAAPSFLPRRWMSWSFWIISSAMGSVAVVRSWRRKLPRIWSRVWLVWSLQSAYRQAIPMLGCWWNWEYRLSITVELYELQ